jgi:phosphatidylserine/phosphatidylglycerophosphate/cardiolipin synthase-like enzyme
VLAAILDLATELPPATLKALSAELESSVASPNWPRLGALLGTQAAKERLQRLAGLLADVPELDGRAIALTIQASAHFAAAIAGHQRVEIAWTGPGTEAVPLRRVDQVLYELIESAAGEILLVTYAAYKAERALTALRRASDRGIRVTLVIELAHESGGKISFDGLKAIRAALPHARVFYWPLERRPLSVVGSYGSMHVKCVIADRIVALVSSANLTDYALELNMELGLLVHGALPNQLAAHFEQLIWRGELIAVEDGLP